MLCLKKVVFAGGGKKCVKWEKIVLQEKSILLLKSLLSKWKLIWLFFPRLFAVSLSILFDNCPSKFVHKLDKMIRAHICANKLIKRYHSKGVLPIRALTMSYEQLWLIILLWPVLCLHYSAVRSYNLCL